MLFAPVLLQFTASFKEWSCLFLTFFCLGREWYTFSASSVTTICFLCSWTFDLLPKFSTTLPLCLYSLLLLSVTWKGMSLMFYFFFLPTVLDPDSSLPMLNSDLLMKYLSPFPSVLSLETKTFSFKASSISSSSLSLFSPESFSSLVSHRHCKF